MLVLTGGASAALGFVGASPRRVLGFCAVSSLVVVGSRSWEVHRRMSLELCSLRCLVHDEVASARAEAKSLSVEMSEAGAELVHRFL